MSNNFNLSEFVKRTFSDVFKYTKFYKRFIWALVIISLIGLWWAITLPQDHALKDVVISLATDLLASLIILFIGVERILKRIEKGVDREPELDKKHFSDLVAAAEDKVHVSDTFTYFATTYRKDYEPFVESVKKALKNGADVKILLLKPESPAEEMRTKALNPDGHKDGIQVPELLDANLRLLHRMQEQIYQSDTMREHAEKFQIHLHNELPELVMHRADSTLYISALPKTRADETEHLKLPIESNTFGDYLALNFDRYWENSISLDFYMLLYLRFGSREIPFYFVPKPASSLFFDNEGNINTKIHQCKRVYSYSPQKETTDPNFGDGFFATYAYEIDHFRGETDPYRGEKKAINYNDGTIFESLTRNNSYEVTVFGQTRKYNYRNLPSDHDEYNDALKSLEFRYSGKRDQSPGTLFRKKPNYILHFYLSSNV